MGPFRTHPLLQNIKKMEEAFGEIFFGKVSQCRKTERRDSLVSPGIVLRGKQGTTFFG